MSDFDLVIRGDLILPDRVLEDGWVAVLGGTIAKIGQDAPPDARVLQDHRGAWILPGVVDGQTHAKSQLGQEGIGQASRAAAAGGVTVMVDMPYDDPTAVDSREAFEEKVTEVRSDAHVDVALHATIPEDGRTDVISELIDAGAAAFKFSTFEAAPSRFPRIREDHLADAFRAIAPTGLACGVHNQMQEITRANIESLRAAGDCGWDAYARAHPPLVEDLATALVYEIGVATQARAHVVHISTSRGFEIAAMYRAAGHHASVETCVQYLMLNHEEHARRLGALVKHYPPLRPAAETEKLWRHIAAGRCTFVSSDHVSWGLDRKGDPDIFANKSGGPGLETLLPAFWTGCEEHGLAPTVVAQLLCAGPADHFRLGDRKGRLVEGHDADIVILSRERYRFDPSSSLSAVQWSAFEGRELLVRPVATYVRGQLAWDGSRIANNAGGDDRFLRPRLSEAS